MRLLACRRAPLGVILPESLDKLTLLPLKASGAEHSMTVARGGQFRVPASAQDSRSPDDMRGLARLERAYRRMF